MKHIPLVTLLSIGVFSNTSFAEEPAQEISQILEQTVQQEYATTRSAIAEQQRLFQLEYSTSKRKNEVITRAQEYLLETITEELIPQWYGTAWDFSGTSDNPQQGAIACGGFVSTILNHAGFKFDRVALGRLHAGNIILNLDPIKIGVYEGRDLPKNLKFPVNNGLYIAGLDTHVGFLLVNNREVIFIHASNEQGKVVAEPISGSDPVSTSHYKVLGKLLDKKMIARWLKGEEFPLNYKTTEDYKQKIILVR